MLMAHGPGNDMDMCAKEELYFIYTATTDDELQTVVVFTVQVLLVVVVAFHPVAPAAKDIGKVQAEDNLASVLLLDDKHGIACLRDVLVVEDGIAVFVDRGILIEKPVEHQVIVCCTLTGHLAVAHECGGPLAVGSIDERVLRVRKVVLAVKLRVVVDNLHRVVGVHHLIVGRVVVHGTQGDVQVLGVADEADGGVGRLAVV